MTPIVIGLTGSIGMGKSTTAQLFADEGIPVWSADEAVHRLYANGGAAVPEISKLCPECTVAGSVDRSRLSAWIMNTPNALASVEKVVHPLVAADRTAFVKKGGADIVLADIPLLFETGADAHMNYVVVASAPPEEQRRRVLSRPDMSPEKLDLILSKQIPDAEKRARADFVIETISIEAARKAVQNILKHIKAETHA